MQIETLSNCKVEEQIESSEMSEMYFFLYANLHPKLVLLLLQNQKPMNVQQCTKTEDELHGNTATPAEVHAVEAFIVCNGIWW